MTLLLRSLYDTKVRIRDRRKEISKFSIRRKQRMEKNWIKENGRKDKKKQSHVKGVSLWLKLMLLSDSWGKNHRGMII